MIKYTVLGIMSGTSLDGVDIALCEFQKINNLWKYKIVDAKTYPYSTGWREQLSKADSLNPASFIKIHHSLGQLIGENVIDFLSNKNQSISFIASHGHTVFHEPNEGIYFQIGDGASIVAKTGISVICDFRSLDIALGGQGAPLVPIGDELLFNDYNYCLNLGGFANISGNSNNKRIAFDICPVNIVINHLVKIKNLDFDKDGELAKKGKVDLNLLDKLNSIPFYHLDPPKSLGKEWLTSEFLPIINKSKLKVEDKLRTIYEHIVIQISSVLKNEPGMNMLVTGGGAFNKFLIKLLRERCKVEIILPPEEVINFKEALIFAFLGVLRYRNEINCLSSVTGAKKDNIGGAEYKA